MTVNETENTTVNTEINTEAEEVQPANEEAMPALDESQMRAAALAYARYLRDNDIELHEKDPAEDEEAGVSSEDAPADAMEESPAKEDPKSQEASEAEEGTEQKKPDNEDKKSEARKAAALEKIRKREEAKARSKEKFLRRGKDPFASVMNVHDKVQDGIDGAFVKVGKDVIRGAHRISDAYSNTRRGIGAAILITGMVITAILIVFDMFTVYEYAYNGKVLGYVNSQEEVTDVLDVAGRQLTYNSSTEADVKFVANQNVTFNPVDGRGKSTDDSDTVVNKLIYMTDIETEAYAVATRWLPS